VKFLTGAEIWQGITRLAKRSGPSVVAVPYLGRGASEMLSLQPGSLLVPRFERSAIRAGQVCPADVIQFLESGVRVFNQPALHAKVYAFTHGVIIGSSNASKTSRDRLVEACIETDDLKIRRKAEQLVMAQASDEVDIESARLMLKEYREPVGFPLAVAPTANQKRRSVRPDEVSERPLWLVPLFDKGGFSDAELAAFDMVTTDANRALNDDGDSAIDVMWCSLKERERLDVGDIVLLRLRDKYLGIDELLPPAKILSIRKVRGVSEFAVAYSQRKRARSREIEDVSRKLGQRASALLSLKYTIRPASSDERAALLGLWSVARRDSDAPRFR
jgi:hypothetical protein